MRHPSARRDGRGDLNGSVGPCCWLLIGNSRWHWGVRHGDGPLHCWSARPPLQPLEPLATVCEPLAWAAVGELPAGRAVLLPERRRLTTAQVPLPGTPPWLGVDRALASWRAWRLGGGRPVLVADAGTALSLTRVGADGRFAGGRLLAGAGLQLRALALGTAALPELDPAGLAGALTAGAWPADTRQAMAAGVLRGLAAALDAAARECRAASATPWRLWLTGGDGPALAPLLQGEQPWRLAPNLVLEALAELRPGPDP